MESTLLATAGASRECCLPPEILAVVFSCLNPRYRAPTVLVCREWSITGKIWLYRDPTAVYRAHALKRRAEDLESLRRTLEASPILGKLVENLDIWEQELPVNPGLSLALSSFLTSCSRLVKLHFHLHNSLLSSALVALPENGLLCLTQLSFTASNVPVFRAASFEHRTYHWERVSRLMPALERLTVINYLWFDDAVLCALLCRPIPTLKSLQINGAPGLHLPTLAKVAQLVPNLTRLNLLDAVMAEERDLDNLITARDALEVLIQNFHNLQYL
ncbi:hypothetical protein HDU93_003646 [Gonapodya sp. JEL0774]|nr:hypothetical protein HDU93_003646 [Gonapodya sp. JEL0774]